MKWLLLNMVALIISCFFFSPAFAEGDTGSKPASNGNTNNVEDQEKVAPYDIRKKYFKRYPFAKKAFESDKVEDQESQEGKAKSIKVLKKCEKDCNPQLPCHVACQTGDIKCYFQPEKTVSDTPATMRDMEVFENLMETSGLPLSDTQFQIIDRENRQRLLELLYDPERWMWMSTNTGYLQGAAGANSVAKAAEQSFQTAYDSIDRKTINVADDRGNSDGFRPSGDKRTYEDAVKMVQRCYKELFLQMAILLLLPGAIFTQVKNVVSVGFSDNSDARSPFEGILRSIIAIFLIPATQLIMSYSIDCGNSMADSVRTYMNRQTLFDWQKEQSYDTKPENMDNGILGYSPTGESGGQSSSGGKGGGGQSSTMSAGIFGGGGGAIQAGIGSLLGGGGGGGGSGDNGQGKGAEVSETKTVHERQLMLSQVIQAGFNAAEYAMSGSLIILTDYQLVYLCYLLCLGPIAAAFFAWPQLGQKLFRNVFSSWLNSVIVLSLWRFYWCVILAVMTQRIIWLMETGGLNPNLVFEMMVFTCFLGMMLYVPFQPFDFDPGQMATQVMEKGSSVAQGAGQKLGEAAGKMGVPQGMIQQGQQALGQAAQQVGAQGANMRQAEYGSRSMDNFSGGAKGAGDTAAAKGNAPSMMPQPPSTQGAGDGKSGSGNSMNGMSQPPMSSLSPNSTLPGLQSMPTAMPASQAPVVSFPSGSGGAPPAGLQLTSASQGLSPGQLSSATTAAQAAAASLNIGQSQPGSGQQQSSPGGSDGKTAAPPAAPAINPGGDSSAVSANAGGARSTDAASAAAGANQQSAPVSSGPSSTTAGSQGSPSSGGDNSGGANQGGSGSSAKPLDKPLDNPPPLSDQQKRPPNITPPPGV